MSVYWIKDGVGRVLGPLSMTVLEELVHRGRVQGICEASRDGKSFVALKALPELQALFQPRPAESRMERERQQAFQLKSKLEDLRNRPASEVLGVKATASLEEHRSAFFALAKRFHPGRLPEGTDSSLREACTDTFQFLSALMSQTEKRLGQSQVSSYVDKARAARAAAAPGTPARPAPPTRTPPAHTPTPSYSLEQFVGLAQGQRGLEATVQVNAHTAGIFTDHHTVNLRNDGLFLPTRQFLPLGTMMEVHLVFEGTSRRIDARGKVVWENLKVASHLPPGSRAKGGLGVRLFALRKEEVQFIQKFVDEHSGANPA